MMYLYRRRGVPAGLKIKSIEKVQNRIKSTIKLACMMMCDGRGLSKELRDDWHLNELKRTAVHGPPCWSCGRKTSFSMFEAASVHKLVGSARLTGLAGW